MALVPGFIVRADRAGAPTEPIYPAGIKRF
jgi:hypothetical protein